MTQFMWIWNKNFFFLQLFESGKFSTKVENFPLCIFGLKFGKREGPEPENKISPKWKIFHQKWKNFHLCRMFQFMWFWNNFFFFEVENFPVKWKKFHYLYSWWSLPYLYVRKSKKVFCQNGNFCTKSGNLVRHPALVLHVLCFRLIFLLKRNT